jgi:ABC-type transport system involved in multi-copper enzyme maturation permease subunit
MNPLFSWPVARATLRERAPAFVPALLAVLLALAAYTNASSAQWGGAAFTAFARLFLISLTIALGVGLIADELDSGHAQLVLLRPITRAQWFGGRLIGGVLALAAGVGVAWIAAGIAVLSRGGQLERGFLLALPATLLEGAAWLSVLAALSVVLRRWTNAAAVMLIALAYVFAMAVVPVLLRKPELVGAFKKAADYLGPQSLADLLKELHSGSRASWHVALYDLLWFFAPWLIGVLLLNGREIARRRA